ncbi:unnamed protein product [Adineta ricciae]|uniref:Uncharacterized protein n=1 Tax=Adineta ricciae TaxID=249248 RepID=A0A815JTH3_ADIRI|nr:unnamed protein product [Adineta ricciae]
MQQLQNDENRNLLDLINSRKQFPRLYIKAGESTEGNLDETLEFFEKAIDNIPQSFVSNLENLSSEINSKLDAIESQ